MNRQELTSVIKEWASANLGDAETQKNNGNIEVLACHIADYWEHKPYWDKYYEAQKSYPRNAGGIMTARELVCLGFNQAYIYGLDGKTYQAGYVDYDGIANYDLTDEQLDNWVVEVIETDYDADNFPIITAKQIKGDK